MLVAPASFDSFLLPPPQSTLTCPSFRIYYANLRISATMLLPRAKEAGVSTMPSYNVVVPDSDKLPISERFRMLHVRKTSDKSKQDPT